MKTYDLTDEQVALIHEALPDLRIEPVCEIDQRLVYTPQAFREHENDVDADDTAIEDALLFVDADDRIYRTWASICDDVRMELGITDEANGKTDQGEDRMTVEDHLDDPDFPWSKDPKMYEGLQSALDEARRALADGTTDDEHEALIFLADSAFFVLCAQ